MTFSYFHAFLKLSFRIYLLWRLDEPLTDRITLRKSNICNCQRFIRFRRIYYERGLRNVGCLALWKWTSGVSVACMVLSYFSQLSIYLSIFYYFFFANGKHKMKFLRFNSTRASGDRHSWVDIFFISVLIFKCVTYKRNNFAASWRENRPEKNSLRFGAVCDDSKEGEKKWTMEEKCLVMDSLLWTELLEMVVHFSHPRLMNRNWNFFLSSARRNGNERKVIKIKFILKMYLKSTPAGCGSSLSCARALNFCRDKNKSIGGEEECRKSR